MKKERKYPAGIPLCYSAKKRKFCFVALLLFCITVCTGFFVWIYQNTFDVSTDKEETLLAVTSFYPVYIAAANVARDCEGIKVQNLSEPQTGCLHDFQLTPEDMKLLSSADVFFVNGGGMENFLSDVAEEYPDLTVIETAKGLELSEDNAHVWMSITRYRRQVEVITEEFCEIAPEYAAKLKENTAAYDEKLKMLCQQQEEIKKAAKRVKVISFHDAYAYLADDYGFETVYAMNLDEERQVSAKETADTLLAVNKDNISIIFAEELYGKDFSDTIKKESDVKVYYLDTLVRGDEDLNSYVDGMQKNINILKAAFGV